MLNTYDKGIPILSYYCGKRRRSAVFCLWFTRVFSGGFPPLPWEESLLGGWCTLETVSLDVVIRRGSLFGHDGWLYGISYRRPYSRDRGWRSISSARRKRSTAWSFPQLTKAFPSRMLSCTSSNTLRCDHAPPLDHHCILRWTWRRIERFLV